MHASELAGLANTAVDIAMRASRLPMAHFRAPLDVIAKADQSPVTIADRETESFIRAELARAFPEHGIFGEEHGVTGDLNAAAWIIDPIDGTRSFISGHPLFGMLLGFLEAGQPQIGIVRMPALDETFVGIAEQTATLNGIPIRCRTTASLPDAILYLNEAEKIRAEDPSRFARLSKAGQTRRMAYDCYPHALVAAGQIDAVVDCGLEPYDYLPLVALIEAAGGIITDWSGAPLGLQSDGRVVTAATVDLHRELLSLLDA